MAATVEGGVVVIVHPELVASEPFAGTDVAKEKGLC